MTPGVGRIMIVLGLLIVVVGLVLTLAGRVPFLGKLPGDLSFKWGNARVYFPIVTCLVLSLLLTIILNIFRR